MHRFRHLSLNHRVRTLNGYDEPVLTPDRLMSFAMEWVRTPASRPTRSIDAIKRAIYRRLR